MNNLNNKIYENLELLPLDLHGWHGDSKVFMELIKETRPEIIVEIGTWKGQSAINMANCCKTLGLSTKIYCIDTWLGSLEFWYNNNNLAELDLRLKNGYPQIYYQFLSNVVHKGFQDTIIPVPLPSTIGLELLKKLNVKPKLIYIDGSHEYHDTLIDVEMSSNILANDGVMFGDDYFQTIYGVKKAVDMFSNLNGIDIETRENNFWIIRNEE